VLCKPSLKAREKTLQLVRVQPSNLPHRGVYPTGFRNGYDREYLLFHLRERRLVSSVAETVKYPLSALDKVFNGEFALLVGVLGSEPRRLSEGEDVKVVQATDNLRRSLLDCT
jgi:hypothetical protein